ncbi:MFS transporter [Actinomyces sp. 186855]|nr:MFS transporter [Actinomyces sp. AC-20-1]MCL3789795.1 MFS transporter [Actinomyces sp. 187325]MCL3793055.1 MFS transporter [Actinomyces sp. 186855]MCL3794609.1 MFS transporter [Actinomyces sp. 217892]
MSPEQRAVLAVLLIPTFASLLAVSSVNVLLTVIQDSLGASASALQWVIAGYSLVFGVLLVAAGRAGDVLGRARLFVIGLALFGLGSLGCALAGSIGLLNLSRVVMGVGAGLFNPQVTGMIQRVFPGPMRGRAFGWFGAVVGVSVALGPVMSGVLLQVLGDDAGWRASFAVNTPIAAAGVLAAWRVLPAGTWQGAPAESAPGAQAAGGPRRADVDPVGMILLAASMLLLMLPFVSLGTGPAGLASALGAVACLGAWTAWERWYLARGREPMVDLRLFRQRSFSGGCLVIAVYFFGCTSIWIVVAQYVQQGLGRSALTTGVVGLPSSLIGAVLAPVVGRYVLRAGRAMVLAGIGVVIAGLALTAGAVAAQLDDSHGVWVLALALALVGVGQALVVSPNQTLSLMDVPLRYAGTAGGVLQTGQRLGTATGVAVISSLAFAVAASSGWERALIVSVLVIIASLLVAGAVAVADIVGARREARAG